MVLVCVTLLSKEIRLLLYLLFVKGNKSLVSVCVTLSKKINVRVCVTLFCKGNKSFFPWCTRAISQVIKLCL